MKFGIANDPRKFEFFPVLSKKTEEKMFPIDSCLACR